MIGIGPAAFVVGTLSLVCDPSQPFPNAGSSGNNTLLRVKITWSAEQSDSPGTDEWIIKCWRPGGNSDALLGLNQPLEALVWQHGLTTPGDLPQGVVTPVIGAKTNHDLT